jgi:hypothetical protein
MLAEAGAAISSIKTAMDIVKGVSSLKSETEVNLALIEIQRTLLDAQASAFEDRQKIAELSEKLADTLRALDQKQDWASEQKRYKLTRSDLGAYTYDLKDEFSEGEVFHRICAKCYGEGMKSILHIKSKHSGGEIVRCLRCNSDLILSHFVNTIATISRSDRWDDF